METCKIIDIDSDVDHRYDHLEREKESIASRTTKLGGDTFVYPNNERNQKKFDKIFQDLSGETEAKEMEVNVLEGRNLKILGAGNVALIDHQKMFNGNFGASDFIAICDNFGAILLTNMQQMSLTDRNLVRRFILFVINFSIKKRWMNATTTKLNSIAYLKSQSMRFFIQMAQAQKRCLWFIEQ